VTAPLALGCERAGREAGDEAPDPENPGRNIPPELAKTHRAIALDLPGYGLSNKPLDAAYGYDFYADTLDAFLDALGTSRAIGRQPIDAEARNPNHTR
jgi:pimeloyl-ACP methyl ester carboxylesterase